MVYHLLEHKRRVWRRSTVADGMGGRATVWAPVGDRPVRCRIAKPRAAERTTAEQAGSRHDHNVMLAPGADVRRGDQLRDVDDTGPGAKPQTRPYLDVVSVVEVSTSRHRIAECVLIQPEVT